MNWRNPEEELPGSDEIVWGMLEPHKDRGGLLKSAPSIEIVAGWVNYGSDGSVVIQNADELGQGSIMWYIKLPTNEDNYYINDNEHVIAWLPVEEMPFPEWRK